MENTAFPPLKEMENTTSDDYDDYEYYFVLHKTMNIFTIVIYSLAFVLGVIGNGLVIFITGFRMKKTVNTVWFLNLSIADFTLTLFLPFSIAYIALGFHWPFGQAMCKFNTALAVLNLYASVYLLMVISIDRCISVRYPVWAQNHRSPRLASFVTVGIWIVALVLTSPNFHFKVTAPDLYDENMIVCFTNYSHNLEQSKRIHHAMITSRFIFAFIIPFTVIVVCYGAIVLKLRRNRLTQSTKPFKVITAVIVAFFLCWLPYHIFSFIETKVNEIPELHLVILIGIPLTSSLAYINSCLNPILYVFMGHDFKERLKRSLFSAFENAFAEDGSESTAQTKVKSSSQLDSQDLIYMNKHIAENGLGSA